MIKEYPEDFIVEEVINLDFGLGDYLYIKLTKKNWNTLDVINEIAKRASIPRKNIGFAGTKDRRAVTTQYISLRNAKKEKIENLEIKDVTLEIVGTGKKPISLGDLEGNKFRIKFETNTKISSIVNYFGPQRFSKNNPEVGKAIIKKEFKLACELIQNNRIQDYLQNKKNDYIGALKKLDKKLLSLYVNSYQSSLWNKAAEIYIDNKHLDKIENIQIPLISFETEFDNSEIERIYTQILKEEGLELKDFIIRSFPDITPTKSERDLIVEVKDFKIDNGYVEFFLPKGSYATTLLQQLERFLKNG